MSVHFIPLHIHPYYREMYDLKPEDFPVAYQEFMRDFAAHLQRNDRFRHRQSNKRSVRCRPQVQTLIPSSSPERTCYLQQGRPFAASTCWDQQPGLLCSLHYF